ncbi:methyltransferase domain-containing protein [Arsenicicoccus sp. oral taxon 190]|uniref:methyltransferase domain-containing protein n=1 Tax=Arsenicicoccus sp. oral taxon 190 TaxID=1658671 RepID=UPI00067A2117|nr:methyltransferase domain-containing protein [Arsenicicoccus sp. oral taxon 190]AKT52032.1 methyltransferase [Arsenicicoccus sp. oral taxon 190]
MPDQADPAPSRRSRAAGVETNLRTAAVWDAVRTAVDDLSGELGRPLRILDLGGGTGGIAVALAGLGHEITVVDPSPDALAALDRRAQEAGVADRVRGVQGDGGSLAAVHEPGTADLVCCHGVLEFVDDPAASLAAISAALAPHGLLSLTVAQRLAVVLARALAGQFSQAQHALTTPEGRWGSTDPLPRRFDLASVSDLVEAAGLEITDAHGVRIFSDLVPSTLVDSEADRMALLDLERAASSHPEFAILGQLGSALHVIAARH